MNRQAIMQHHPHAPGIPRRRFGPRWAPGVAVVDTFDTVDVPIDVETVDVYDMPGQASANDELEPNAANPNALDPHASVGCDFGGGRGGGGHGGHGGHGHGGGYWRGGGWGRGWPLLDVDYDDVLVDDDDLDPYATVVVAPVRRYARRLLY